MELRQMAYVVAVGDYGTVTEAARKLHVSQSALSMSYRNLERELGVKLMTKEGRNLVFTDQGRVFYRKAKPILEEVEELQSIMGSYAEGRKRSVRLYSDVVDISTEAVQLYSEIVSDVTVFHYRVNSGDNVAALFNRDADVALSLFDPGVKGVRAQVLFTEPMNLVVSRKDALSKKKSVSIAELRGIPLVTQTSDHDLSKLVSSFYEQAWVLPGWCDEVSDPEAIMIRVNIGGNVGFVPQCVCNTYAEKENSMMLDCIAIPLEEEFCQRSVFLLTKEDSMMSSVIEDFVGFLVEFGEAIERLHAIPEEL